jgi:hypothetical protein
MRFKFFVRLFLLTIGFGLTTAGLLSWKDVGFSLEHIWPFSNGIHAHPVHALVLGMALIPPTLWEIFVLENKANRDH